MVTNIRAYIERTKDMAEEHFMIIKVKQLSPVNGRVVSLMDNLSNFTRTNITINSHPHACPTFLIYLIALACDSILILIKTIQFILKRNKLII